MTIEEIQGMRALLLSDRLTIKGTEVMALNKLLAALQRDENAVRVTPAAPPVTVVSPAGVTGG
jgi:hypothetical protein